MQNLRKLFVIGCVYTTFPRPRAKPADELQRSPICVLYPFVCTITLVGPLWGAGAIRSTSATPLGVGQKRFSFRHLQIFATGCTDHMILQVPDVCLYLILVLQDYNSSLPNCLPRTRLHSLAADGWVRSTRVCLVSIYIYIYRYSAFKSFAWAFGAD